MSIRRHNAKRDANEPLIVAALEALGCIVHRMDTPCDLLAQHRGQILLIEVKTKDGRLTADQARFAENWPMHVVRTVDDAIALIQGRRKVA